MMAGCGGLDAGLRLHTGLELGKATRRVPSGLFGLARSCSPTCWFSFPAVCSASLVNLTATMYRSNPNSATIPVRTS